MMPDSQSSELRLMIKGKTPTEALQLLSEYLAIHPDSAEAYTLRGLRHWSLGHRAAAIKDYLSALRIDPHCSAKQALAATNDILNYYNKDLYNP